MQPLLLLVPQPLLGPVALLGEQLDVLFQAGRSGVFRPHLAHFAPEGLQLLEQRRLGVGSLCQLLPQGLRSLDLLL